jgi:hypothetical protein
VYLIRPREYRIGLFIFVSAFTEPEACGLTTGRVGLRLAKVVPVFEVRGADGGRYLVRHDERSNTWELTMFRAEQVGE